MMQRFAISAHRDGFRRAGRAWNRAAEIVAADALTEDQLEQLRADPNVTVTPCAPEGPAADGAPDAAGDLQDVLRGMSVAEFRGWLIRAAMRGLDRGSADDFTVSGLPEVAALKEATGLASVSAAERDALWAEVQG